MIEHRYGFAEGDPVGRVDPTGEKPGLGVGVLCVDKSCSDKDLESKIEEIKVEKNRVVKS
jgi:hypothetical protein